MLGVDVHAVEDPVALDAFAVAPAERQGTEPRTLDAVQGR